MLEFDGMSFILVNNIPSASKMVHSGAMALIRFGQGCMVRELGSFACFTSRRLMCLGNV